MHLPSQSVPEAGQKLAFNRLRSFINSGNEVHLISFVNERELAHVNVNDFNDCKSVHFVNITKIDRLLNFLKTPWLPIPISVRNDKRIKAYIKNILTEDTDIHIEYEQGMALIPCDFISKSTVVFHDVISQSYSRFANGKGSVLKRLFYSFQHHLLLKWEKKYLGSINSAIVLSEKDLNILKLINNSNKLRVSVDFPQVSECFYNVNRDRVEKNTVMFWGAMNREENIDAVNWFVEEIYPLILEKKPDLKFYIVGANPPERICKLASDSVIVTGFVDDPIEFFEKISVAVVPLRYGAGVKLKVLEALAANIPIVTTSVGAEGISTENGNMSVTDDKEIFSNKVIELIK